MSHSLEAGSPRSRCRQGRPPSEGDGEGSVPGLPPGFGSFRARWPHSSVSTWRSPVHVSVRVQISLFIRTPVTPDQGPTRLQDGLIFINYGCNDLISKYIRSRSEVLGLGSSHDCSLPFTESHMSSHGLPYLLDLVPHILPASLSDVFYSSFRLLILLPPGSPPCLPARPKTEVMSTLISQWLDGASHSRGHTVASSKCSLNERTYLAEELQAQLAGEVQIIHPKALA